MSKVTCLRCGNTYPVLHGVKFVNTCSHCTKKFGDDVIEVIAKQFREFKR